MLLKKRSLTLDEYLKKFKNIYDILVAIGQPISDIDQVFQLAQDLSPKYQDFKLAMLIEPPYPIFNQFVLTLQGHEQALSVQQEEEK